MTSGGGARRARPGSLGPQRWLEAAAAVVAAAVAAASLLHFWHAVGPIAGNRGIGSRLDFSWFFYAMRVAWDHRNPAQRLYSVAAQDLWMRRHHFPYDHADLFGYPPPFALLWAPLGALTYEAARQLWTEINLLALGLGIAVAAWHASPAFRWWRWLLLAGLALWAQPLISNFYWGQPNALILALLALGVAALCRPRPPRWAAVLGGIAIGLAAVLKVTPAILLVYFPLRWLGDRRSPRGQAALWGSAAAWATAGAACLASGLVLGWSLLPTYVLHTLPAVEHSAWVHGPAPWNQSFRGILMIWPGHAPHALTRDSELFGLGALGLCLLLVLRRPALDPRLEAALASGLVLLCSPSLEDHHFTVAILPWLLLGGYLLDRGAAWLANLRGWPAFLPAGVGALCLVPLGGAFAVASLGLAAPSHLRWPPPLLAPRVTVPVPAGRYQRVFILGSASYGPVPFMLRLLLRGAPARAVPTSWPDWWSPGRPLTPVLTGAAVRAGHTSNPRVGIYGFAYPVPSAHDLRGIAFPAALPRRNGGQEALHVVAVTLERASPATPRYLPLSLAGNAHGIAATPNARVAPQRSFDGTGNLFWSPTWPAGRFTATVSGSSVPFDLPSGAARRNVLSLPAPNAPGPGWFSMVVDRAPFFVAIASLFLATGAATLEGDGPGAAPGTEAAPGGAAP